MECHEARIARMRAAYRESHGRFVQRLKSLSADLAQRTPPGGGWSAAQIGWHVAAVDASFAALVSGERPAPALPESFVERAWSDVIASIPDRLEASGSVVPPAAVPIGDVLRALEESAAKLDAALAGLTPARGSRFGVTHEAVGTVSLYQVGDWAVAHTIRHNAQAKRVLASERRGA